MSPLWRDEIGIFIGPSKLVLARMRRGVRPDCVAEQGVSIKAAHYGDWQPALEELGRQVSNELWQNANVRVVISDHWTRYAILPWSSDLTGPADRLAHAKLILKNTYGEVVDEWTVSLSDNPPRATTIISAVPTPFLDEIDSILSANKLRLISLQPHLIVAYNGWRERLPHSAAWFASIDDGLLAALHLTNGRCDSVRSVRISGDWSLEMRRMQTMGRLARDRPNEGPVFVDAPVWLRKSSDQCNTALEWLDDDRAPRNIADKVSLLKGMYS